MKVTAIYSGFVGHEGVPILVTAGQEYDEAHPLVRAQPQHFTEPAKRGLGGRGRAKDEGG